MKNYCELCGDYGHDHLRCPKKQKVFGIPQLATVPAATVTLNLPSGNSYTFSVEDAKIVKDELNRIFSQPPSIVSEQYDCRNQIVNPAGCCRDYGLDEYPLNDREDLPF